MSKKMIMIQEFILAQLNHWTFFLLAFSFSLFFDYHFNCGTMGYLEWAVGGLLVFGLYFIRKYIHLLVISILLHICALAGFCLIPLGNGPHIVIYAVAGVIYCAFSIKNQVQERYMSASVPVYVEFGMAIFLLLIINYYDYSSYNKMFVMVTIILTGVYFIFLYLKRYNNFIYLNSTSAGYLPAKDILKSGGGLVIAFIVIMMLLAVSIYDFQLFADFFELVKSGLRAIAMFFAKAFAGLFTSEGQPEDEGAFGTLEGPQELMTEQTETAPWMVVASFILWMIVIGVLIFIIVKMIIKAVKWLKKNRVLKSRTEEEGVLDVRERIDSQKHRADEDSYLLKGGSADIKIRKLFRKTVKAKKKLILAGKTDAYLKRKTAHECAKTLGNERIAELYEQARYAETMPDSEAVKEMKQVCRQ